MYRTTAPVNSNVPVIHPTNLQRPFNSIQPPSVPTQSAHFLVNREQHDCAHHRTGTTTHTSIASHSAVGMGTSVYMYVYMCVVDGVGNKYIESRICIPNLTLLFWIYCTQRAVTTYSHMLDVTCACGSLLQVSSASGLHFVGGRLMRKFWQTGMGMGEW
jgi:hypothetical protein